MHCQYTTSMPIYQVNLRMRVGTGSLDLGINIAYTSPLSSPSSVTPSIMSDSRRPLG